MTSKNTFLTLFFITAIGVIVLGLYNPCMLKICTTSDKTSKIDLVVSGKARIIDGDSIKIGKNEIRLIGIDAPEWSQTCKDANDKDYKCGMVATNYLKGLTKDTVLRCTITGIGYYKRLLGICLSEFTNINKKMVREGWAISYGDDVSFYDEMLKSQESKKGIWQGRFEDPHIYRKKKKRKKRRK